MPRNLSSSVSMFIEDSRVAAVANANASPVNPANFYTISNVRHTANITPAVDTPKQYPQHQRPATLNIQRNSCISSFDSSSNAIRSPREIVHRIHQEGDDDSSGVSSVNYHHQTCQSGSDPSRIKERQRVSVSLQPSTPWVNVRGTVNNNSFIISSASLSSPREPGTTAGGFRNEDRGYTSVNLHLKSPSDSNCEYSCSTQISSPGISSNYVRIPLQGSLGCCHSHCGGNSVTYSSYSNFRDGFESQLQIQIGPQGGTISASRRRNSGGTANARQQMNAGETLGQTKYHNLYLVLLLTFKG